jgi:uncharacterized protein (DUF1330 family)
MGGYATFKPAIYGGENMNKIYTVVAALAGVALGSIGTQFLKGQKSPAGYYIAEVFEVTNQDQFKIIEQYGGHYVVRRGKTQSLEGAEPKRIVIIAFNSVADAEKRYNSAEYFVSGNVG